MVSYICISNMNRMNKFFFLLLFLPLTACTENVQEDRLENTETVEQTIVKVVNVDDFEKAMANENVVIVDVRTDGEVARGVIPGAVQIDFMDRAEFEKGVAQLDKDKDILVYCKVGGRSAKAAKYLEEEGFQKVFDLKGGFDSWSAAGKQTEKLQK